MKRLLGALALGGLMTLAMAVPSASAQSPYGGYSGYGGYGGSSYTTTRPGPTSPGGGSRSTSTTTSRGGFGGTGHATAGS